MNPCSTTRNIEVHQAFYLSITVRMYLQENMTDYALSINTVTIFYSSHEIRSKVPLQLPE
jgi:hypothetical protein